MLVNEDSGVSVVHGAFKSERTLRTMERKIAIVLISLLVVFNCPACNSSKVALRRQSSFLRSPRP